MSACNPCNWISDPFLKVCPKKYAPMIRCSARLAIGVTVIVGVTTGFTAGLAVYNAVCPDSRCTGLSDAKSYLSDTIPFIGAFIGLVALPAITCGAAQAIGCCFRKRQAVIMERLPEGPSDNEPLLGRNDP